MNITDDLEAVFKQSEVSHIKVQFPAGECKSASNTEILREDMWFVISPKKKSYFKENSFKLLHCNEVLKYETTQNK